VLSRAHRLTSTLDYSRVVRRGARFSSGSIVMHVAPSAGPLIGESAPAPAPTRFGFVVSKAVGNAPTRNAVKRRLKALARPLAETLQGDVIFRALPSASTSTWQTLSADVDACVEKYSKGRAR
jgi:ribonuclease P protein component